jgi:hypothetical protein
MRPTPDEVDAVLFDMIAAQAAQVPDDTSLDDFWWAEAVDPQGEVRGYGLGHTPAEALTDEQTQTISGRVRYACGPKDSPYAQALPLKLNKSCGIGTP